MINFVLLIIIYGNGTPVIDKIDGFTSMQACQNVAGQIEHYSNIADPTPSIETRCIEVQ